MENNPMPLKSSMFGGFKKKDVLSYIFELNESTQDEKQRLAEQIEELIQSREKNAASVSELERQIAALRTNLDDTTVRLDEATKRNAHFEELVSRLKAEVAKHESTIERQNAELSRHATMNAELTSKNRIFEEKKHQVELAAEQIADLLGQAKEDAIKVADRAKLEAEEIINNAKTSIERHVEDANKSMDSTYKKFSGFKSELESLGKAISDATAAMNAKVRELGDQAERIGALVPDVLTVDKITEASRKSAEAEPMEAEPVADAAEAEPTGVAVEAEATNYTNDVLKRYGVRKDDSGFFRLASDR